MFTKITMEAFYEDGYTMSWEFASGGSKGFQLERLFLNKGNKIKAGEDQNNHYLMSLSWKGQHE